MEAVLGLLISAGRSALLRDQLLTRSPDIVVKWLALCSQRNFGPEMWQQVSRHYR